MRTRGPLSVLFASALSLLVAAPAFAADVLIFGPSNATEEGVATGDGHTVTVADEATWSGMTTEQFAAFDAIVIGDGGCTDASGVLDAAITNRTTWSAAVDGPVIVHTFDPGAHNDDPDGTNQDIEVTSNGIGHAGSGPGTGLYFAIGCYYSDSTLVELTILDGFGQFIVDGLSGDFITIIDGTHPAMTGLTDEGLSGWGSSTHSRFTTFPESFEVLAVEGGEIVIEGGGSNPVPLPVMLAQGVAVPTPTPTPTVPGTAAPTPTPATSQLPNTTASAPGTTAPTVVAMLALLVVASVAGVIQLRRRGVGAGR